MTRFPRLTPEAMSAGQRAVAAEISAGPRGEVRGPFIALLHNAGLARRWNCQHEWVMHDKLARKAGLEPRTIDAVSQGREPQGMSADETLVYRASKQAHEAGRLDDETFAALRGRFGLDGVLDLLWLNGYYSAMAMVLNTAGMPLPENAAAPLNPLY